jgi:hypothetical protein
MGNVHKALARFGRDRATVKRVLDVILDPLTHYERVHTQIEQKRNH